MLKKCQFLSHIIFWVNVCSRSLDKCLQTWWPNLQRNNRHFETKVTNTQSRLPKVRPVFLGRARRSRDGLMESCTYRHHHRCTGPPRGTPGQPGGGGGPAFHCQVTVSHDHVMGALGLHAVWAYTCYRLAKSSLTCALLQNTGLVPVFFNCFATLHKTITSEWLVFPVSLVYCFSACVMWQQVKSQRSKATNIE